MRTLIRHAAVTLALAMSFGLAHAADKSLALTGAQEVPPVATDAKGTGTITIGTDKLVRGSIKTTGFSGTAAHIHLGEVGQNGPPIIPLSKASANEWTVPPGATLNDEQYVAYKPGKLYVNVHSDAHKPGEIRTQMQP